MKKKIIFRADGNSQMGLGHMYRVFALIEMCKKEFDTTVITKSTTALEIIPKEYKVDIITSEIDKEVEWLSKKYTPIEHIIVLDGYQFDSNYQKKIKEKGFTLVYIDDLTTEYMCADVVVNHSPHIQIKDYQAEPYTKFALGTDYAMLRPMFLEQAKKNRIITQIDTAFICFGGADFYDLTYKAVNAIINFSEFKEINVVLGGAYKHCEIFNIEDERLKIHKNLTGEELLNLMLRCNFAIVPSSTILFELCCVKMPVLSGYYVDNQRNASESFFKKNMIYNEKKSLDLNRTNYERVIEKMLNNIDIERIMSNQEKHFNKNQAENFIKIFKDA